MPDRSDMKKAELAAECVRLDGVIDNLNQLIDEFKAGPAAPDPEPDHGLLALVYHVGGVEWNGTARRLVRCACSGDWAEKWLVVVGDRMVTTSGHTIPFKPFLQVKASLREKVAWDMEPGLAYLAK